MKRVDYAWLLVMALALAISGCDGQAAAASAVPGSFADQFQTFVGDFARQALAAWLL